MPRPRSSPPIATFGPTTGGAYGVLGIIVGVVVIVVALVHGVDQGEWLFLAAAAFGVAVCWALLLRPRVALEPDELVLRNVVSDYRIPYACIDEMLVRTTTVVVVDGRKYVGIGVGRARREMTTRPGQQGSGLLIGRLPFVDQAAQQAKRPSAADQLEEQVSERRRAAEASAAPVRRVPAVIEIVALVGTAVLLALAIAF